MGCDIHIHAERKTDSGKYEDMGNVVGYLDDRNYGAFGFLADVRNYSGVPAISEPRGIPADVSPVVAKEYKSWYGDAHSASWLSIAELIAFDFDAKVEDRQVTVQTGPNSWNGGATCDPGKGSVTTWRDFLGHGWVDSIRNLADMGADRIVFWFDN
jgi:hypothetical protein